MIEVLATLARFAQSASGCALVGGMLFASMRVRADESQINAARASQVAARWALGFLVAGVLSLACQSALVTGRDEISLAFGDWWRVSADTAFGKVWWTRQALMSCALLVAMFAPATGVVRHLIVVLAALATAAAAASGHAAALDPSWPAQIAQVLHWSALGLWWGGLLPLSLALGRAASRECFTQELQAFSHRATWAMAVILVSGIYLAFIHVERWPALFGTSYGQLLMVKLVLIGAVLALAAHLRWHWLRLADGDGDGLARLTQRAPLLVLVEWLIATLVMLIAAVLAGTPPARHEQVHWPFNFRLAPEIGWAQPGNAGWIIAGATFATSAVLLVLLCRTSGRRALLLPVAAILALTGAAMALPRLTVPAYADTYRSSDVPYHAISIRNGAVLFQQHCVACHGNGGLGDGPLAAGLAVAPADLSAPHTADHTAGDMFWWLSHGMPSGAMPGFARTLDVEARWDLINFLRTFSNGYQARIIRPQVARGQPWLGAPDFNYLTRSGDSGSLKDLRTRKPALLVFYTWPESEGRLRQLASADWLASQAQVLCIPWRAEGGAEAADISLPVVVQGGEEAAAAYALLRRTLAHPDSGDRGALPAHMEMLIDRFGYVRARWLPSQSQEWNDLALLRAQLRALETEPEILPPPDEHIH